MKYRPHSGLLALLLSPLSVALAVPAQAQVEVVALNLQSGQTRVVAAGELENTPRLLIANRGEGSGMLIDECGTAYDWQEGMKIAPWPASKAAPQVFQGMLTPPHGDHYRKEPIAIYDDGVPALVTFDEIGSYSVAFPTQERPFAADHRVLALPAWPAEQAVDFWLQKRGTSGRLQSWALGTSGTLWWAKPEWPRSSAKTYRFQPVQVGAAKAWEGTVAALLQTVLQKDSIRSGRVEDVLLWTIDRSGALYRTHLGTYEGNPLIRPLKSVAPVRIGSKSYGETIALLEYTPPSWRGEATESGMYRVDANGFVFPIDLETGEEGAGVSMGDGAHPRTFAPMPHSDDFGDTFDLVFCRSLSEQEFAPCLDRRSMIAAQEASAKADALAAAEREEQKVKDEAAHREKALQSWLDMQQRYLQYKDQAQAHIEHHEAASQEIGGALETLRARKDPVAASLETFDRDVLDPTREALRIHVEAFGRHSAEFHKEIHVSDIVNHLESSFELIERVRQGYGDRFALEAKLQVEKTERSIHAMDVHGSKAGLDGAREWANAAVELAPGHEHGVQVLGEIEAAIQGLSKKIETSIANVPWPQRMKGFTGTGDLDTLEAEALAFVNHTHGGDHFAAYLDSNWIRNQTNAIGDLIDYQINFTMVRRDPENAKLGILVNAKFITDAPIKVASYRTVFLQVLGRVALDKAPKETRSVFPAAASSVEAREAGGWGITRWILTLLVLGGGGYWAQRWRQDQRTA